MIQITGMRDKGNGEVYHDTPKSVSLEAAIRNFIKFELGYGGQITTMHDTGVTVNTRVMGCVDTTVFSGLRPEFDLILEIAQLEQTVQQFIAQQNGGSTVTPGEMDTVMQFTQGNPRLIEFGAEMIIGTSRIRRLMVLLLQPNSKEEIDLLLKKTNDDLLELVILKRVEKIQPEEYQMLIA